ncbi:hypothetical protein EV701_11192 [Chthoniobacter flavus]|nr:hypothetical protein EV701_11192 [Chthoniobacter flavus]
MASFSWISIPLCIFANLALGSASVSHSTKESAMGNAIVIGFIALTGILCGIIALCGIPKYGTKGLLWPALTGILLWLGLGALAVPTFALVRKKAEAVLAARVRKVDFTPATHTPGAKRLQDAELAFSFDLPPGYQPVPAESVPKQFRYIYVKPGVGEPPSVIIVSLVGTGIPIAGQHVSPSDLPPGKDVTLTSFSWRGLAVDGFRVPEKTAQGNAINFNVQLPLKKRLVQVTFGGPATKEAALHSLAIQTLATFEGEPNWP